MSDDYETDELHDAAIESDAQWRARQLTHLLQKQRDEKLDALTHTLHSGHVIQCRPRDEQPIRNAIERMQRLNMQVQPWRMKDNTHQPVTVSDLEDTLAAGQDLGAEVWAWFMQAEAKVTSP